MKPETAAFLGRAFFDNSHAPPAVEDRTPVAPTHADERPGPQGVCPESDLSATWARLFALDETFAALASEWLARDADLSAAQDKGDTTIFYKANRRDVGDRIGAHVAAMTKGNGR